MGEMERARQAQADLQRQQAQGNALEAQRAEAQRLADLRDPGSEASRQAQATLMAIDHTITPEEASQMTGEQIDRMLPGATAGRARLQNTEQRGEQIEAGQAARREFTAQQNEATRGLREQTMTQQQQMAQARLDEQIREFDARHRGGHGGGTAALQTAAQAAVDSGLELTPAQVQALGSRGVRNVIAGTLTARGRAGERETARQVREEAGNEILPGVHATIEMPSSERATLRRGYDSGRMAIATFQRIGQIADQAGPAVTIDPQTAARIGAEMIPLRSFVAQMQGTGIINPSEVPVINAALTDPRQLSNYTFGTLRSGIDEWRRLSERNVRATLANRGVSEAEQETAVRQLFGGMTVRAARGAGRPGVQAPAPPTGGQVRMRRPDGSNRLVPADRAAAAEAAGWVRL
jgi:hypothetical protein